MSGRHGAALLPSGRRSLRRPPGTTNKSVKEWPEVLAGDEVMTAALLDRLLHQCQ
ncbi:MAG: ATP-binding protein [Phycisphaerales bacterium JB041]